MNHKIDIASWKRKEHYHFFSSMELPYHGYTVVLDCSRTYAESREKSVSFSALYMHKILRVIQSIEALKLRIVDNEVILYETINASGTALREDETFGYTYLTYTVAFEEFAAQLKAEKARIENGTGLQMDPRAAAPNMLYYTVLPWLHFSHLEHARGIRPNYGIPQVAIGKMIDKEGLYSLPIALHVHHALADGLDVGKFYQKLQDIL